MVAIVEQKDFNTYEEGKAYMDALAAKMRGEGFNGKLNLKVDNLGGKPVTFTLKTSGVPSKATDVTGDAEKLTQAGKIVKDMAEKGVEGVVGKTPLDNAIELAMERETAWHKEKGRLEKEITNLQSRACDLSETAKNARMLREMAENESSMLLEIARSCLTCPNKTMCHPKLLRREVQGHVHDYQLGVETGEKGEPSSVIPGMTTRVAKRVCIECGELEPDVPTKDDEEPTDFQQIVNEIVALTNGEYDVVHALSKLVYLYLKATNPKLHDTPRATISPVKKRLYAVLIDGNNVEEHIKAGSQDEAKALYIEIISKRLEATVIPQAKPRKKGDV